MTDEEIIAVVTAHKEGKTIQWKGDCAQDWEDCEGRPCWDFNHIYYRVKPEPHYRPFESAEEVMAAIKKHGDWLASSNGGKAHISEFHNSHIWLGASNRGILFEVALHDYHFEKDGTPFGKMEE